MDGILEVVVVDSRRFLGGNPRPFCAGEVHAPTVVARRRGLYARLHAVRTAQRVQLVGAQTEIDAAREVLTRILCNYRGFRQCEVILVFDAYKVKSGREVETVDGISIVYTKEAETADMYIEKVSHTLSKKHRVRVVTSDALEQLIILGGGALRVSSREFEAEVLQTQAEIRDLLGTN